MERIVLIISLLIIPMICSNANPLLGIWNKTDGPSNVLKYNYLNDSTVSILLDDSSSITLGYAVNTQVTPLRIRWYFAGITVNLGIWSIDGDILTMQGSSGDTINYPPSFTDPSHYIKQPTSIKDDIFEIPQRFSLFQNYPNPFNPSTKINYSISQTIIVTLKVYDLLGKEITTLLNEEKPIGNYEIEFDGSNLSSGIYFYKMKAGNFSDTKKFILLR